MKIWFFDSWLWGKVVMEEFHLLYPEYEMILYMDRENAPYGGRTSQEIRELTHKWVQSLFAQWAQVVILACNTASVHALRWLQNEVYPGRHILWVTVPGAEAVVEGGYRHIGVLATEATVRTRMYKERVHILDDSVIVEEVSAPGLVPLIESGTTTGLEIWELLREYLSKFSPQIEALVLGCTHYPIIEEQVQIVLREILWRQLPIVDPWFQAAHKFRSWIQRHPYLDWVK
jgi:glutamate racemase